MPRLAVFPKGFLDRLFDRRMGLFEWLDLAATLEVDGAELHPAFFETFDSTYVARVRRHASALGLELPMMCHSPDFTQPDAANRAAEVERTADMFRVTAEMGGRWCRVLSGQNRPGLVEGDTLRWVVDCLWALVPQAEAAGVTMCLENHYKDGLWTYPEFAQSHARYLAILDAVDSPRLMAQFDPSNAVVAGEDPYALLDRIVARVGTMHASDRYLEGGTVEDLRRHDAAARRGYAALLRHGVTGRGLNDYDRIFSTLARAGFDGWVSIEDGEGDTIESGMDNLRASARFLRAKFHEYWP